MSDAEYWLDERHKAYHARQFASPYRSTVALGNFIVRLLGDPAIPRSALDVGCGAGANMLHLGRVLPGVRWTGLDANPALFSLGEQLFAEHSAPHHRFVAGDLYRLAAAFPTELFDIVLSIQTLSWLPEYEEPLRQLRAVCKPGGMVFVTSLFTDALVDARIQITQFGDDDARVPLHEPTPYNVYCLARFRRMCFELGATRFDAIDFEMDVDLPPPNDRHMGTFTLRLADGRRLQQSGPLLMPWKFVAIRF